jgi:hypothetical protein
MFTDILKKVLSPFSAEKAETAGKYSYLPDYSESQLRKQQCDKFKSHNHISISYSSLLSYPRIISMLILEYSAVVSFIRTSLYSNQPYRFVQPNFWFVLAASRPTFLRLSVTASNNAYTLM